jgi:adrenodoxin-NADP+ reductase
MYWHHNTGTGCLVGQVLMTTPLNYVPAGIIGTNLVDAAETASSIQQDTDKLPAPTAQGAVGGAGLQQLLEQQKVEFVTAARWQRIDAAELAAGAALGRSREKFVRLEDMLAVA